MKLIKTYASGLLLVFFWQLLVLFCSPFAGATVRPKVKNFSTKGELVIKADQTAKGNTAVSGYFVEEVLEEDYHAPDHLFYNVPSDVEFHYTFHLLIDYLQINKEDLLPPEQMIL